MGMYLGLSRRTGSGRKDWQDEKLDIWPKRQIHGDFYLQCDDMVMFDDGAYDEPDFYARPLDFEKIKA